MKGVSRGHRLFRDRDVLIYFLVFLAEAFAKFETENDKSTRNIAKPLDFDKSIFCICDLIDGGCDVNCCCDPDCSFQDRQSFSICFDYYIPSSKQTCVLRSIIFINNSPFVKDEQQPGFLCIYYDNFVESRKYMTLNITQTSEDFEHHLQHYERYKFRISQNKQSPLRAHAYKSGDPIWVIYENLGFGTLPLPRSLLSKSCIDSNPAAYLFPQTFSCIRPVLDLVSQCTSYTMLQASTYYQYFKVVKGQKQKCELDGINLPSPSLVGQNSSAVCMNVVSRVKYTIFYEEGVKDILVQFTLRHITTADLPLVQTFQIAYLKWNGALDQSKQRRLVKYSGNPGYLVGQPVRAGILDKSQKHHDDWKKVAIIMSNDDQPELTMLTSDTSGNCLTTHSREPVKFGINMRSGCFMSFSPNKWTGTCNESQWAAWTALRGPNPPTHIATFGSSDPDVVGDWVNILDVEAVPPQNSALYDSNKPYTCLNIISALDIEIIFAKVGFYENAQLQIIGARYNYIYKNVLECQGYCQPSSAKAQKFEVVSSVTFVDASQTAVEAKGFVQFPQLSIPPNFFYPFE